MKKHCSFFCAAVVLVSGFCCGAAEGTVNASWLNARVFPELKSPVAVKLPRGKKVEIFKRHGSWLEIAAPDITPVYASAACLNGNLVVRDVNLRVRPHGKGAVIGRVKKGMVLKAVSEPDRFGWVQVAPLPELRLYVVQDYVSFDSAQVPVAVQKAVPAAPVKKAEEQKPAPAVPVKKAEEKKAVPAAPVKKAEEKKPAPAAPVKKAEEKKPVPAAPVKKAEEKKAVPAAPVKKAEAPFELPSQRKRELINIGADITRSTPFNHVGLIKAVEKPSGDCTAYALVGLSGNNSLGFLFAEPPIDLKALVEKEVVVKGHAFRVKTWRNPVVAVTAVSEVGK